MENKKLLDDVGWQILTALQQNARISFVDLGREIGMSAPAVAERVRRMEEIGLITGYRAEVAAGELGLPIMAFIRLQTTSQYYSALTNLLQETPEVLECHHLAGPDAFIIKIAVASIAHLETIIGQLGRFGQTNTSIVLSSLFGPRAITRGAAPVEETA